MICCKHITKEINMICCKPVTVHISGYINIKTQLYTLLHGKINKLKIPLNLPALK